jgi:hypothetical protein
MEEEIGGACSTNRGEDKCISVIHRTLEKQDGVVWTGLIWLRVGMSGGLLGRG